MIRYWEEDTEKEIGRPFDLEKHDKEISDKWLDKVKEAREEIENEIKFWSEPPKAKLLPSVKAVRAGKVNSYKHCLEILDELIAESEGNSEDNG